MYAISDLQGVREFLERTRAYGVLEVIRVSAETIHVILERELWPAEIEFVRRLASTCWALDRVVLAVRADLRDPNKEYDEITADVPFRRCSGDD